MPRLRQLKDKYDAADFQKAVFTAMVQNGMECSVNQLAIRTGLTKTMLTRKIRHEPLDLTASDFRKINAVVCLPIQDVLTLLGYTTKDIQKFKEANA